MTNASNVPASVVLTLFAGFRSHKASTIPVTRTIEPDDAFTLIWNGISKAYRCKGGQWLRAEKYEYRFNVVQQRYDKRWKSVKTLHRLHPDYDGKAGPRDQTMYFDVAYNTLINAKVHSAITSSLGNGTGTSDVEFRHSVFTMYVPNASLFMPYNKLRITQYYDYEEGMLTETVELVKEKDGKEIPFMKNEETALIYVQSKLDSAPTIFKP